jgi:hypothetical protein
MTEWSRAGRSVQLAIAGWRWAEEDYQRSLLKAVEKPTADAVIADMEHGFQTAWAILDDIRDGRTRKNSGSAEAVRMARARLDEPSMKNFVWAQMEELHRLMDILRARRGRRSVREGSAISADLAYRLRSKQDEERRLVIQTRQELAALRREIVTIKKLIADIRVGRLDEGRAGPVRREIIDRLGRLEARVAP